MKQQQSGFTLIELVAVIVLLGILAVTALPKFVNLQADARKATLTSVKGSVKAAMAQVYAKSLVNGTEANATGSVNLGGGVTVSTVYGYPAASAAGILAAFSQDSTDIITNPNASATPPTIDIGYSDKASTPAPKTTCVFTYTEAADASTPAAITAENYSAC